MPKELKQLKSKAMPKQEVVWRNRNQRQKGVNHTSSAVEFNAMIKKWEKWGKTVIVVSGHEYIDRGVDNPPESGLPNPPNPEEVKSEEVKTAKPKKEKAPKAESSDKE